MSSLTEPFPVSLTISGVECPIHWDFRTVLRCQKILQDAGRELTEDEMTRLLRLFYGQYTWYTEEHFDKMLWFFSCGREPERKHFPRKIAGINSKQAFDFEVDADLIYAAFIQQYGIDLQTEEMHWWKFMILLEISEEIQDSRRSWSTGHWISRQKVYQRIKRDSIRRCRNITD